MIAVTPAVSGGDPVTRRCMSRAWVLSGSLGRAVLGGVGVCRG